MLIFIPAFKPETKILELVEEIQNRTSAKILCVDDGSGSDYDEIFEKLKHANVQVLRYEKNHGKGHALKYGFKYIYEQQLAEKIVIADCDGQHSIKDIMQVGEQIKPQKIILGCRKFDSDVPFRSTFGNHVSSFVFQAAVGVKLIDTQTGLRGFSINDLPFLQTINGERFEYEINMLLAAAHMQIKLETVLIETIYIEKNQTSHFDPFADSLRTFTPIIVYGIKHLFRIKQSQLYQMRNYEGKKIKGELWIQLKKY
ncbi:MAG: glycosyltransferase family 2 protein [Mycoplasmatales bacterium]